MQLPQRQRLIMPTYGRHVQRMIEHAVTLPTREERNRCAKTIVRTMMSLHPELNTKDQQHVFYDHMARMSNFRLDIDYPYGRPKPEEIIILPSHIEYSRPHRTFRHYGKIVQTMVQQACEEKNEARRRFLINALANRLKFCYVRWNKDSVDAEQIKADIAEMSNGQLSCDFEGFRLLHTWQMQPASNNPNNNRPKKRRNNNSKRT